MGQPVIGLTILGSTGSVGINTLDVVAQQQERFRIVALSANRNVSQLFEQCLKWQPEFAVLNDTNAAEQLDKQLGKAGASVQVLNGPESLAKVAALPQTDYVMAAIVGAAGLLPTLAAARAGKRVLLANKEALVMAGPLFMAEIQRHRATLLPIDSEHNALFQCMPTNYEGDLAASGIKRLLLTGSGGPFRETPLEQLPGVTPEQACAHPNWDMGRKISVDSATMMNKGLEIIEACWLFNASPEQIQVVIHPQSIIHSMVEYTDGSILAQLGNPDMRTPIAHALAWPQRIASGVASLDLFNLHDLNFQLPDFKRFPCLRLALEALQRGGTAPTTLNAANEIAVAAFLEQRIRFTQIPSLIETALAQVPVENVTSLDAILHTDALSRAIVREQITLLG